MTELEKRILYFCAGNYLVDGIPGNFNDSAWFNMSDAEKAEHCETNALDVYEYTDGAELVKMIYGDYQSMINFINYNQALICEIPNPDLCVKTVSVADIVKNYKCNENEARVMIKNLETMDNNIDRNINDWFPQIKKWYNEKELEK